MSTSFPVHASGAFPATSSAFPQFGFPDQYQTAYSPVTNNFSNVGPPGKMQQFDSRQMNGFHFPSSMANNGSQMLSPNMGQEQFSHPQMRSQFNYQMGMAPIPPAVSMSSTTPNQGPMGPGNMGMGPNGIHTNMPEMGQMTAQQNSANAQCSMKKSPVTTSQGSRPPSQNHASSNVFTAPTLPRQKSQTQASPSNGQAMMQHIQNQPHLQSMPSGSMRSNTSPAMLNSTNQHMPHPPTSETAFTTVTHYDMPPAFPQYEREFKRANPSLVAYYDRSKAPLRINYPNGKQISSPSEPPTFAFVPGQRHYQERFDRRNLIGQNSSQNGNVSAQRNMMSPSMISPAFHQQSASVGPASKKARSDSSDSFNGCHSAPSGMMNPQMARMMPGMFANQPNTGQGANNGLGTTASNSGSPYSLPNGSSEQNKGQFTQQQNGNSMERQHQMIGTGNPSTSRSYVQNGMSAQENSVESPRMQQVSGGMQQIYMSGSRQIQAAQGPLCPACNGIVSNLSQSVTCSGNNSCRRLFHQSCSGLTDVAMNLLENDSNAKWVCHQCAPMMQ